MKTMSSEGSLVAGEKRTAELRIAMWSGPRNISTAMMRSWGNRSDTVVCDEPFYAHYLQQTGYRHHPGYDEILAHQETDCDRVIDELTGPIPGSSSIYYQKHMAHHMLPHISLDWMESFANVFLIRDPREMLLSLNKVFENPSVEETGLPQQVKLLEFVKNHTDVAPVVLDAKDVLSDPAGMLCRLCERFGIPFETRMLCWSPGIHKTDGVWAKHWYANVAESVGFDVYRPRTGTLPSHLEPTLDACQRLYDELASYKLSLV